MESIHDDPLLGRSLACRPSAREERFGSTLDYKGLPENYDPSRGASPVVQLGNLAADRGDPGSLRDFAGTCAALSAGTGTAVAVDKPPSSSGVRGRSFRTDRITPGRRHIAAVVGTPRRPRRALRVPRGTRGLVHRAPLTAAPHWCTLVLRRDLLTLWGFGWTRPEAPAFFQGGGPGPQTTPVSDRFRPALLREDRTERAQLLGGQASVPSRPTRAPNRLGLLRLPHPFHLATPRRSVLRGDRWPSTCQHLCYLKRLR